MNGFDAYRDYIAVFRHFTSSDYNYAQFNGKTRVRQSAFLKRRDQFWFDKIARHHDPHWLIVSTMVEDPHAWVGAIARGDEAYARHKGRVEALEYTLRRDLEQVSDRSELESAQGRHPMLVRRAMGGDVSIESVVVINDVTCCAKEWASSKDLVLQEFGKRVVKYSAFVAVSDKARGTAQDFFYPATVAVDTAA